MNLPFLNPWMLLATAGVAVPVILHLLNRHRPKVIDWAAMDLLRRVVRVRSRQIRLQDILLMLLRCLAILLLALALARPTTRAPIKPADVGALVAVDVSGSMAHAPTGPSRLDRAREQVRAILRTVEPGSPVTLMTLGGEPTVLTRNTPYDADRFARLIDDLAVEPREVNLDRGLTAAAELVGEIRAPQREIYLVTDGQARQWGDPDAPARRALQDLRQAGRVFIVLGSATGNANVAVTDFRRVSGTMRAGSLARYIATVRNTGPEPRDVGAVTLLADDAIVDQQVPGTLSPGESLSVPLYAPLPTQGAVRLTARVATDALDYDNQRHAVGNVRRRLRVLRGEGDARHAGFGGRDVLGEALSLDPSGATDSTVEVHTISWLGLADVTFGEYDMVILANVPDIPIEKAGALEEFVRDGGGLIVFVGDNVDPETLNTKLRAGDEPLLPGRLLAADRGFLDAPLGLPIDPQLPVHPVTSGLRVLAPDLLTEARFRRAMRVEPISTARTLLRLAAGGRPLLLERRVGRGSVLLFTSSADRRWSSMSVNPMFPLLLQEATTYFTRRANEAQVTIPEPIALPLPGAQAGADVLISTPDGQTLTRKTVLDESQVLVRLERTRAAGFHLVSGETVGEPVPVAVNPDPAESDVTTMSAEEIGDRLAAPGVEVLDGDGPLAGAIRRGRVGRELWSWLLLAGLAVFALESALARWTTRRAMDG